MNLQLAGTGVLVTGAGGFLGAAIARCFAAEGASVAVHHRDHTDAEAASALAREIGGVVVSGDLSVDGEADDVVAAAVSSLGRLDACVANAGRFPPVNVEVVDMSLERWRSVLDDNLTTSFLTARAYLRHVADTGTGSLVLLASAAGRFGDIGRADYASAKAAIGGGFLLTLKNEATRLSPTARVNAVIPAWTTSPERIRDVPPDVVARTVATQALPRLGAVEDVANAVVFLASPIAAHITGAALEVTGGMEGRLQREPTFTRP